MEAIKVPQGTQASGRGDVDGWMAGMGGGGGGGGRA